MWEEEEEEREKKKKKKGEDKIPYFACFALDREREEERNK
jgi:hypothetical protein